MRKYRIWIILGIIAILVMMLYGMFAGRYNSMVTMDESVKAQWANVENQFQRRSDLIPNLVATVKGYADFEQETLTAVIEARSKATSIQVDPSKLTPESIAAFQKAQGGVSSALSRLLVTIERYPELKANQNFLELQAQLEGTENRIAVERRRFNEEVRTFNTYVRSFPNNFLAGMYGFEKMAVFEADEGAEEAPKVEF